MDGAVTQRWRIRYWWLLYSMIHPILFECIISVPFRWVIRTEYNVNMICSCRVPHHALVSRNSGTFYPMIEQLPRTSEVVPAIEQLPRTSLLNNARTTKIIFFLFAYPRQTFHTHGSVRSMCLFPALKPEWTPSDWASVTGCRTELFQFIRSYSYSSSFVALYATLRHPHS